MKTVSIIVIIVVLLVAASFLFNLSEKDDTIAMTDDETHMHEDGEMHSHDALLDVTADGSPAPTLAISLKKDSVSGWNLTIQTTNFTFAPEKAGSEHVAGEGHAHLYVDGVKVARVYGEHFHLDGLTPGEHEVKVTLNANSHEALSAGAVPIEATTTINE